MNLEWIFFDAGNTLIGLNYTLLISALAAGGFRVDELTLRRAERSARRVLDRAILEKWGEGALPRTGWIESEIQRDFWRQILQLSGATPYQADALVETVLDVTRPAGSWDRVESSTLPALDALSDAGYRMGIISNSSGTLVEHLQSIGMARRFELIIDSHDVGVEKPHPDIFRLALETSGASAACSLYVGDVYAIDVLGAASAGMHAMLFDPLGGWDPTALPPGAPACRTLRSLSDLRGLLEPPA